MTGAHAGAMAGPCSATCGPRPVGGGARRRPRAGAGAGAKPADVARDLGEATGDGAQAAAGLEDGVQRALGLKVVVGLAHVQTELLRQQLADATGELRVRVHAGAA